MRLSRYQHRNIYIENYSIKHRQEITVETAERKGLRCTESSRTDPTKDIQPKEQEEYYTGSPNIKQEKKDVKEEPIHRISNTGQYGRRGQKIETAEFATHQIEIRTTKARPKHQCHSRKRKGHFANACGFEH